jgi:hypothetical protein
LRPGEHRPSLRSNDTKEQGGEPSSKLVAPNMMVLNNQVETVKKNCFDEIIRF